MRRLRLLFLLLCISYAVSAQEKAQNYICTRMMLNEAGNSYIDNINYVDGLGRPFQTVQKSVKNGLKTGNNLATLQEYDNAGREWNTWLPIVATGDYVAPATFKSSASANYSSDSRPYNQAIYESSPLNRIAKQYGPGAAWYNTHPIATDYLTNTTTSPLNCINYSVSATGVLTNNGNYPSAQLYVVQTSDEDKNISYIFTDKLDRTILSRQMQGSEAHDTYYVYDDFGNLRFVLQPMYQSVANLDQYAFQYKYDGFNRCIWKKLPGAQEVEYTYDNADRLIFAQDGNQRALAVKKWTYYLYDTLGRLVQQGECTNKSATSGTEIHIRNYYDSYTAFRTAIGNNTNYPDDTSGYSKGSLTGSIITVLGGSTPIWRGFYYDVKGRVTKTVENNLLSGYDITSTVYSFTNKPATVTHTHTATGKTTRTEVYAYTYDHADRVNKVQHTLGGTTITLYDVTYDNIGRLFTKSMHGSATNKLTYTYNLRSWLTGISGTKFTQNLYYNTGVGTAKYNGSISSMNWKAGDESALRGYKFTYDGMDRMLNATYGETASINTNANQFSENVTSYDKNGNIKTLQRYGQLSASTYGLLDNLTYTLTGNQLNRVDDTSTASVYGTNTSFVNGASIAGEYAYDANGNLTQDLNKGIEKITYNVLNLPSVVTFSDKSTTTYTYTADGTKLRTAHKIGSTTTTMDYCGNVIYENGVQKMLLTEEGYVNLIGAQQYHYYLKDHQGNNRVVINQGGQVEETNHYYPFGGLFASTNVQPYKYNGKELDIKKGLNWYDYGARMYDPTLGRFTTVDAMAEKHYEVHPYAYCGNSPVVRIDPDGNDWRIQTRYDRETDKIVYQITVNAVIYNNSNNQNIDMKQLASSITQQVNAAYTISQKDFVSNMNFNLRVANSLDDIKERDHVIQIVDQNAFSTNSTNKGKAVADASNSGLSIRLSTDVVKDLLNGTNKRTVAHELGHTGGLSHMKGSENATNLMMQAIDVEEYGNKYGNATYLNENQVKVIRDNYIHNKLNKNSPLYKNGKNNYLRTR